MSVVRISGTFAAAMIVLAASSVNPATSAELASPWVQGFNHKVRLIAGRIGADAGGKIYAGFEISMPEGWKTYWRTVGEAGGVPPEFDFSHSENLADAIVLYPAPTRLTDKSGSVLGYENGVVFPVAFTAKNSGQPVRLHVKAAFGVCNDLCIPAEADVTLDIPPTTVDPLLPLTAAFAAVPRKEPAGGEAPQLSSWRLESADTKPKLVLEVRNASGAEADAFVEAPAGIFMPLPKRVKDVPDRDVYEVDLTDGVELKAILGKPLIVTLVGGKSSSETTITLK